MNERVLILGFDIESSNLIFQSCNKHFGKSEIINSFLHKYICHDNQLSGCIIYAITQSHSYQEYISYLRRLYRHVDFDILFNNVIVTLRTNSICNSCKIFINRLIKNHEQIHIVKFIPNRKLERNEIPYFHCWSILGDSKLLPDGTVYIPVKQAFDIKTFDVVVLLYDIKMYNLQQHCLIK